MALIDRVKIRTGSDLPDSELQAMIVAIGAELALRLGPVGPVTVELGDPTDPDSRYRRTHRLARPIDVAEDVTIVERDPANNGNAHSAITLEATDYRVMHEGRTLQRLLTGPNGREFWAPLVTVSYTPIGAAGEQAARDEATIKLIHLDLTWRGGMKREKAGDYELTLADNPTDEREKIIAALETATGGGMAMA